MVTGTARDVSSAKSTPGWIVSISMKTCETIG
jgi:hypothetical protein